MNAVEAAKHLAAVTKEAVARALAPIGEQLTAFGDRLKALEDAPQPSNGQDGRDGQDASPEQIAKAVSEHLEANPIVAEKGDKGDAGEKGEQGEPGEAGRDGTSPSVDEIAPAVATILAETAPAVATILAETVPGALKEYLEANPVPAGEKGERGADGKDGKDGKDATSPDVAEIASALAPVVQDAVAAHFEANPVPAGEKGERGADGKDGKDGEQISDEQIAQQVERFFEINPAPAGRDGKDGRDGRDAEMLTEDKIFSQVERYMRQHPVSDGADGLGFDDLSVVYDGGRNITLSFSQGENKKEFTFKLNMMIYQGVFKQGTTYEQGDSVTFGGSVWTAKKDTKERPMEGSDWQLSVKCGRDGKDGQKGDKGEKGQDGRNWEPTKGL